MYVSCNFVRLLDIVFSQEKKLKIVLLQKWKIHIDSINASVPLKRIVRRHLRHKLVDYVCIYKHINSSPKFEIYNIK